LEHVPSAGLLDWQQRLWRCAHVKENSSLSSAFYLISDNMTMETEEVAGSQEEAPQELVLLPDTTIMTHCIYKNAYERLLKSFDDDTDPYNATIMDVINDRDFEGKTPLDLAACYGRTDIVRELLKRGADMHSVTEKGKRLIHEHN
jgi:hypothetical protein